MAWAEERCHSASEQAAEARPKASNLQRDKLVLAAKSGRCVLSLPDVDCVLLPSCVELPVQNTSLPQTLVRLRSNNSNKSKTQPQHFNSPSLTVHVVSKDKFVLTTIRASTNDANLHLQCAVPALSSEKCFRPAGTVEHICR